MFLCWLWNCCVAWDSELAERYGNTPGSDIAWRRMWNDLHQLAYSAEGLLLWAVSYRALGMRMDHYTPCAHHLLQWLISTKVLCLLRCSAPTVLITSTPPQSPVPAPQDPPDCLAWRSVWTLGSLFMNILMLGKCVSTGRVTCRYMFCFGCLSNTSQEGSF